MGHGHSVSSSKDLTCSTMVKVSKARQHTPFYQSPYVLTHHSALARAQGTHISCNEICPVYTHNPAERVDMHHIPHLACLNTQQIDPPQRSADIAMWGLVVLPRLSLACPRAVASSFAPRAELESTPNACPGFETCGIPAPVRPLRSALQSELEHLPVRGAALLNLRRVVERAEDALVDLLR
jgi:hypothetical protein